MEEFTFFFRDYHSNDKGRLVVLMAKSLTEAEERAEKAFNTLAAYKRTMVQWFRCGLLGQEINYSEDYRRVEPAVA